MSDPRCRDCAACCLGLPGVAVRITTMDELREPRLATHGPAMAVNGPCPFLDGRRCTIYATRPDACRSFPVAGVGCQTTRTRFGLPLL